MKKLYDLWVKYCPIPRVLGLNKKEVPKKKSGVAKNTKPKAKEKGSLEKLSPHKLKRINKTKLIALASGYDLNVNMKMTKNQIIDSILDYYNNN